MCITGHGYWSHLWGELPEGFTNVPPVYRWFHFSSANEQRMAIKPRSQKRAGRPIQYPHLCHCQGNIWQGTQSYCFLQNIVRLDLKFWMTSDLKFRDLGKFSIIFTNIKLETSIINKKLPFFYLTLSLDFSAYCKDDHIGKIFLLFSIYSINTLK